MQPSENVHLREVIIVDALILSSCCRRGDMTLQAVPELLQLAVDEQHLAVQLQGRSAKQVRSVLVADELCHQAALCGPSAVGQLQDLAGAGNGDMDSICIR